MATTITATAKNIMLTALGSTLKFAALYNVSGVEISGGTPAYARKPIVFRTAAAGVLALTATSLPTFDVPAATTVAYVGYCTATTGGTRHCVDAVTNETFAAQGTYALTSGNISLTDPA